MPLRIKNEKELSKFLGKMARKAGRVAEEPRLPGRALHVFGTRTEATDYLRQCDDAELESWMSLCLQIVASRVLAERWAGHVTRLRRLRAPYTVRQMTDNASVTWQIGKAEALRRGLIRS